MVEHARPDGIVIAIDGPAGAGKSSTAKAVASRLGYRHLDSGGFYRTLTLAALWAGIPVEAWDTLTPAELDSFGIGAAAGEGAYTFSVRGRDVTNEIRSAQVNANVSYMAVNGAVRSWLMDALRNAGRRGGLVADGRDIGTVVFPDAELKVYLVCAPEERARRRLREQQGGMPTEADIVGEAARLASRDTIDSTRAIAPLTRDRDAVLVDTTGLDFAAQVAEIVRLAGERMSA